MNSPATFDEHAESTRVRQDGEVRACERWRQIRGRGAVPPPVADVLLEEARAVGLM
jgi:hypothetical protein